MRKNLYVILVSVTGTLLVCILLFSKKAEAKIPSFKERAGGVSLSAEWLNTKKAMQGLLAAIEQNPEDYKAMLQLSQAYIQESRITGNHGYYDKAALELLDKILEAQPKNFDALCFKATVLLSQHHFAEGLTVAQQALPINPDNAFIYGILCDANLELGKYDEAVKMADKMVSVRPDIRSYSRVSYLREIYGDMPGAKQAIKLAIAAGYPGLEQTEWTRCILAHLYENTGILDSAEYQYKMALQERPDYAFAIAGLGRIAKAQGNYKDAIYYFEKAKGMIIEFSFSDELTDLYRLNKQPNEANTNAEEVIRMLGPNSDVEGENGHGHYADKELAYAYLKINDIENALKHALLEYERRPANIDVSETLAWVKYKNNEFTEANKLINAALKTNSKNPVLLTRAGLIKIKAGEIEKGKALIKTAREADPFLDIELRNEANPYLALN
ncbi:MAG TPA: CDC27 family protein [Bacteroidia bacterium]|jgi:tetratricopeptide (TPR) repeat protein|nr:CDC27 family protein [Bacteroidia bacterium]